MVVHGFWRCIVKWRHGFDHDQISPGPIHTTDTFWWNIGDENITKLVHSTWIDGTRVTSLIQKYEAVPIEDSDIPLGTIHIMPACVVNTHLGWETSELLVVFTLTGKQVSYWSCCMSVR